MTGFKNFLLRGNLIEVAVALVMATSFGLVVKTFTNWFTAQLPESASDYFSNIENSFGAFMNAIIAFVITAAVLYFVVVAPYTKAKQRFFPDAPAGEDELALLKQIRDSLAK